MKSPKSLLPSRLLVPARALAVVALCAGLLVGFLAPAAQAAAQGSPSGTGGTSTGPGQQTANQPNGPSAGLSLNAALARLARDPQNSAALVDAGTAAMLLGDFDAAIGFFTRADQVRPGNGLIKAQIGSAMLNAGQPFEAINWFDQAEGAGADPVTMASDRGLAYDLIGDNTAAQRQYQRALSRGGDEEATRRYAISLAIAGDRRGAESILAPQIQRQDRPAWRVRTFIVAILGDTDEAVGIANASMPASLAQGITPYLRYLPRLTPSQQAAAANLGRFPRAAEIGRDEPRVVQYALLHPRAPKVDSSLIPAGEALGGRGRQNDRDSRSKRGRGKRGSDTQIAAVTPARPPSPLMVTSPWGLQPRPPEPSGASIPGAPQAVPAAKPTVLSKLDLPPRLPRPASSERTLPSTPVSSTPLPSTPVSRPPMPKPPLAETRTPIAALPATNSIVPERTPPKAAGPSAPVVPPSVPSATVPETILPKAVALPEAPLSPPAQPLVPALSDVLAEKPTLLLPVAPQASPKSADPAPEQAKDFGSAFMDFKPPTEEQQTQVAAVDLTMITPARPRSAKSPQPDAIPLEAAAKEGKDTNGKVGKNGKNASDSKANSKNGARGERPDGPTSVARISDADKEQADARSVKVSRGGKAEKDRKDTKDSKDSKDSKAGKNAKSGLSHPSRIWVQVLTGANRDVMVKEWRNMVREAGGLKGRKPFTTPWRSNFRLLTGPFESDAAAQDFINGLRKDGVSGFQWTSPAGQAIDTLQLK